ncbi:mevalonate kinase [Streptomyces zingiberis]|uniref:mevalonate kinase n=1 Tax=Streptomyces zingiberis TaxID=2053010 RepID=A0ABX1BTV8_9ACTN|nr:mevalonate kinase [Streptomyces zingiberis]NJQ01131.1 mevalonate kinase [Streptomyces zingiberis]
MSTHRALVTEERSTATGEAHGKAILLGEHAVVYGAPALALPLPALGCRATVRHAPPSGSPAGGTRHPAPPAPAPGPSPDPAEQTWQELPEEFEPLLDAFARRAGLDGRPALDIRLDSRIPPSRGLGSSAAHARALVRALDGLFATGLGPAEIYELVQVSERSAHGLASGIDAWTTGSDHPVLLAGGTCVTPPVGTGCHVVVADSGRGSGTRQAVGMLRDAFTRDPAARDRFVERSGTLTRAALADLAAGRLPRLGERLTDCHELLAGLGLTTERTDALARAAVGAGALGAKMSGGGLGGCVIALTTTAREAESVAAALAGAFGARTWTAALTEGAGHDGL